MTDRRFLLALYRARSLAFKQRSNASTMAAKDTAFTIVGEFGWPKFWADRIRLGKQAFGKTAFWKTEFWVRILGRFSVRPAQAGQSQRWPTSACLEQVWPAKAGQWPGCFIAQGCFVPLFGSTRLFSSTKLFCSTRQLILSCKHARATHQTININRLTRS